MEYEGFELPWAEDVIRRYDELAKTMVSRGDPSRAAEEAKAVYQAVGRWGPREVNLGGYPKIEVRTRRASILIIVLPPRHRLLATESARESELGLEWAEGSEKYPVIVYYSRKGVMTTAAYLYLGNVMEDNNVGILFVNGPPSEVDEVIDILERKGEYMPDEEVGSVEVNF